MKQCKKAGLTGSHLKWIAIITMLIDHTAVVLLERGLLSKASDSVLAGNSFNYLVEDYVFWNILNLVLRLIGRLAFPIFCFLLVEGFLHTKNKKNYALRLGLFALISEVPFDLAVADTYLNLHYQNVFFTLLIGLLVLWGLQHFEETLPVRLTLFRYLIAIAGMAVAMLLKTDYDAFGVLLIVLLYEFRYSRKRQCIGGAILTFFEGIVSPLAFLFVSSYNGERGKQLPKYFFYAFYPAHLLLLYLIRFVLL